MSETNEAGHKFMAFSAVAKKLAYALGETPDKAEPIYRAIINGYGEGHADACDACRKINAEGYSVPSNVARPDDVYHSEIEGAMPDWTNPANVDGSSKGDYSKAKGQP